MDAYSTEHDLPYIDSPPVLLVGEPNSCRSRAEDVVRAFGLRVAGPIALADASQRLASQPKASAVWIELGCDEGPELEGLVARLNTEVCNGRYAGVISAPLALIDRLWPAVDDEVQLILDAGDADRASALAIALGRQEIGDRAADVASDQNAERLRQLSDEVSRIASTLARLSTGPAAVPPAIEQPSRGDVPAVSAEVVRAVIRARRLRTRYFQEDLFADPAWDMLLDLLQAEIAHLRVPVSSLCIAAAVPATTALRWLKTMVSKGLFVRRADPHDGRRVFVELAPEASTALRRYFAEVGAAAVI